MGEHGGSGVPLDAARRGALRDKYHCAMFDARAMALKCIILALMGFALCVCADLVRALGGGRATFFLSGVMGYFGWVLSAFMLVIAGAYGIHGLYGLAKVHQLREPRMVVIQPQGLPFFEAVSDAIDAEQARGRPPR